MTQNRFIFETNQICAFNQKESWQLYLYDIRKSYKLATLNIFESILLNGEYLTTQFIMRRELV